MNPTHPRRRSILAASLLLGSAGLAAFLMPSFGAPRQGVAHAAPQAGSLSDAEARALLGRLVGLWAVAGRSFDANGQPDSDLSGSAAYNWTLGGLFLAGEQVLTNGSDMLHWVDFIGYNQTAQAFSRTLLSDRDPVNFCSAGTWDAQRRVLTFITDPVRAPDGTERRIRAMLDLSRDDQPGWELNYLTGSGATERLVGTVGLIFTRAASPGSAPGVPAGVVPGTPGAPAGAVPSPGPMTPQQVQSHLDGVLRQKQQMQQQIEDMRKQIRDMSGTIRSITQP
ncbi:MAG: DUF1579 family protein [Phycisphaeraceae bacterium]|nr:DUF1579 family protein [Phycisphaeraceae bacterium]